MTQLAMSEVKCMQGKHIVLGVCGGIAAYKAADLTSKLQQAGALVDVVLTEHATSVRPAADLLFAQPPPRLYRSLGGQRGGRRPAYRAWPAG